MKLLVSRCLLGESCRFDGRAKLDLRQALQKHGLSDADLVAVCPECDGGLPTPRAPSELIADASEVLTGHGCILSSAGADNTAAFIKGARIALEQCRRHGIRTALLKARSPSCGSGERYDGTFSGTLIPGDGLTARLLKDEGILVLTEDDLLLLPEH